MRRTAFLTAVLAAALCCLPVSAEETETPAGDINRDGVTDAADAGLLVSYLLAEDIPENIAAADMNGDKQLDARDLTRLKRLMVPGKVRINEPKGTVHHGEATFYGGGYEGGCAMLDPVSTDYWITAMNLADYNCAELAGAYLEVTGELGTINVLVTDLLPEGKKGDLDLYVDAFPLIAPAEKGRVPVSWKIIPLDTAEDEPLYYKYKDGSSAFWCGVQVRNHRYPIETLEYLNEDGEFEQLTRRNYNYFEKQSGLGEGPFTFRITDIYGQTVIDENIPFTPDEIQKGHVQLPL